MCYLCCCLLSPPPHAFSFLIHIYYTLPLNSSTLPWPAGVCEKQAPIVYIFHCSTRSIFHWLLLLSLFLCHFIFISLLSYISINNVHLLVSLSVLPPSSACLFCPHTEQYLNTKIDVKTIIGIFNIADLEDAIHC